jgi:glycosyltransferase involved in cell wall biosynthesis
MSCGRPVVAFRKGGATETVAEGQSGVFFDEQSIESLNAAVERCSQQEWPVAQVRAQAEKFSVQVFINGMNASIQAVLS